jgi:hypothetical protein
LPSEECVARWVTTEADHMPREDYAERLRAGGVDLRVRTDAVDWIWKVGSCSSRWLISACTSCVSSSVLVLFAVLDDVSTGSRVLQLRPCHCLLGRKLPGPLPIALPPSRKNPAVSWSLKHVCDVRHCREGSVCDSCVSRVFRKIRLG